ncbi:MAG: beta-ketoacyl-[acyl-carrier-protein] synthase family protein [Isosphaeraceae bacterium]|nr:beta-ketoacyl-[acyl-carrier-protein] synthase family protein [Isosphaeraceae bacterium]
MEVSRLTTAPHPPRVFVTGIGLVTGLGWGREATWSALRAGRSAARVIEVPGLDGDRPWVGFPVAGPRERCGVDELLDRAFEEAWGDSRLAGCRFDRGRVAVLIGRSKGSAPHLAALRSALLDGRGDEEQAARLWWGFWPNAGASRVATAYGLLGPCLAPIAACATGLVAALQGADLIRRGACDLALVGAVDASLEPLWLAAFRQMRVLAPLGWGDDPTRAVRPWDRRRSGFLVGEGAAVLVLEHEDHARSRGALPYAELAGGALGSDAHHLIDLNADPSGLAHVLHRALSAAGLSAAEIDHVNVHGTATRPNDPLECRALRLALGPHAERVSCSANKAQIGHLLGAAGAAELALTCLALRDGFVPPTLNLTDPDPACNLDGTPLVGRSREIRAALKVSIGFGGHLAAAVLRRPQGMRRGPTSDPEQG